MTKYAMVSLALVMLGCSGPKTGSTDTDTGTETGAGTETGTGTGTEPNAPTSTETETGTSTTIDMDTGPLTSTGGELPDPLEPSGCLSRCVADVDAGTSIVEADCDVCDFDPVMNACLVIAPCEAVMDEWTIPAGQEACFAVRVDGGGDTPSTLDDLSQVCLDAGSNAEISVFRSSGAPVGTFVAVTCAWSTDPARDCPDLMSG